jgi:hypothetical protein
MRRKSMFYFISNDLEIKKLPKPPLRHPARRIRYALTRRLPRYELRRSFKN